MADSQAASPPPAVKTPPKAEGEASPTPVFGSASTFGSATGFAGFTGVDASKSPAAPEGTSGGDVEEAATEEECQAEFKPLVQLAEVETSTGEEAETTLADFKCKLYRFDNDSGEWKERGVGQTRFLQHNQNKKIRLLMRQEKTLKIRANHIVMPGTKLQEHSGNEKAWVWSTFDFADEEQKMELFCMRFSSVDRAKEFKTKFEEAMDRNDKLLLADEAAAGEKELESPASEAKAAKEKDASDLADQVGKVSVADSKE
ncbi:hypothetical protein WJX72_008835 [[Myrmecia] bisecta]|uniref:RanBD1 domain-containing protein n=1 Tax=[Myrmecia] bisecta TaxID=41462 RepID=A0AAW1PDV4_9CHLO